MPLSRQKITIVPVNKILFRFSAQNSLKQLYALNCAFCWEPFANKWHFASSNIYTLHKLSRSTALKRHRFLELKIIHATQR